MLRPLESRCCMMLCGFVWATGVSFLQNATSNRQKAPVTAWIMVSDIFGMFIPNFGEMIQALTIIFSDGVVQPNHQRKISRFFEVHVETNIIRVFPKIMVPPNHPFVHRGFPLFSPSILGVLQPPYFWKHPSSSSSSPSSSSSSSSSIKIGPKTLEVISHENHKRLV